jgi:DNA-binding response OmpR family regulator
MGKALILIIDPSRETRAIYADYFRFHGYDVVEAGDGAEGVRLYGELAPDLVVTELSGDPDWVPALGVVRSRGAGSRTPIIACSTVIDAHWPYAPSGLEVDSALAKPTSPRKLLMVAEHLLSRGGLQLAGAFSG